MPLNAKTQRRRQKNQAFIEILSYIAELEASLRYMKSCLNKPNIPSKNYPLRKSLTSKHHIKLERIIILSLNKPFKQSLQMRETINVIERKLDIPDTITDIENFF